MARIRSIKPEFWNDRKLSRLSRDARLLYIALWNLSDEHGRLHGDARYVKGHCFPYDDDMSLEDVDSLLDELQAAGRVIRYEHDEDPYLYLPTLGRHQRLEATKQPSRLPSPDESTLKSERRADKSVESADNSAEAADLSGEIVAQQVAGSREQVAGSRGAGGAPADAAPPDRFADFWTAYPRRVGRGAAIKAWKTAAKKTDADAIISAAVSFAASVRSKDPEFIPHPSSWLNGERWADERPQLRAVSGGHPSWKLGDWDV